MAFWRVEMGFLLLRQVALIIIISYLYTVIFFIRTCAVGTMHCKQIKNLNIIIPFRACTALKQYIIIIQTIILQTFYVAYNFIQIELFVLSCDYIFYLARFSNSSRIVVTFTRIWPKNIIYIIFKREISAKYIFMFRV